MSNFGKAFTNSLRGMTRLERIAASVSGMCVVFTVWFAMIGAGCTGPQVSERMRVAAELLEEDSGVDYSPIQDGHGAGDFYIATLRFQGASIKTLGFRPRLLRASVAFDHWVDVLTIDVGNFLHNCIYVVRYDGESFGVLVASEIPGTEDRPLSDGEISEEFLKNRFLFEKLEPFVVYVEPWLYADATSAGIAFPPGYRPWPRITAVRFEGGRIGLVRK